MGDTQAKKGGKNLSTSASRKARYANYKTYHIRDKNKLKRIRQSCGVEACLKYAMDHTLTGWAKGAGLID